MTSRRTNELRIRSPKTRIHASAPKRPALTTVTSPTCAPGSCGRDRPRPLLPLREAEGSQDASEVETRPASDGSLGHERLPDQMRCRRKCRTPAGGACRRVARRGFDHSLSRREAGRRLRGGLLGLLSLHNDRAPCPKVFINCLHCRNECRANLNHVSRFFLSSIFY